MQNALKLPNSGVHLALRPCKTILSTRWQLCILIIDSPLLKRRSTNQSKTKWPINRYNIHGQSFSRIQSPIASPVTIKYRNKKIPGFKHERMNRKIHFNGIHRIHWANLLWNQLPLRTHTDTAMSTISGPFRHHLLRHWPLRLSESLRIASQRVVLGGGEQFVCFKR